MADRAQFIAMKVAEAWETYEEMLPDLGDSVPPVPWKVYARATERIAAKLWERLEKREKKKASQTRSLETLLEEPAIKDYGHAEVEVRDTVGSLGDIAQIVTMILQGYTHAEIADTLKISERTVRSRVAIAKSALSDNRS